MFKISKPAHEFLKNSLMKLIQPRIAELVDQRNEALKDFNEFYTTIGQIKELMGKLNMSGQNRVMELIKSSCLSDCLDITSFGIKKILESDPEFESEFDFYKEKSVAKINFFYWRELLSVNPVLPVLFNFDSFLIKQINSGYAIDVTFFDKQYSSNGVSNKEQTSKLIHAVNQDTDFTQENIERIMEHFLSFEVIDQFIGETSNKIKQELQEMGEPTDFNLIPRINNNLVCSFNQRSMFPLIHVVHLVNLSKTQNFIDLIAVDREVNENPSKYIEFGDVQISVSKRILGKPRKVKIKLNSIANWLL